MKVSPTKSLYKKDKTVSWLYKPRYLSALIVALSTLIYYAFTTQSQSDIENSKQAVVACILLFTLIGILSFKNGPFIRPHPAFWRAVLAISIAYEMALVLILFQNKQSVRRFLHSWDERIGVELPEKSYAQDCFDFSYKTIASKFDIFVIGHAVGWFGKAIVLRDYWFCWINSVMFGMS